MRAFLQAPYKWVPSSVIALFVVLTAFCPAIASQLVIRSDCKIVVGYPGLSAAKPLNYSALKGAVFAQNSEGKFCGTATVDTPFGLRTTNACFGVANGQLISGMWNIPVSSSNCVLVDDPTIQAADEPQISAYAGAGPANLRGQAFLKTVGGDVKTCAGEEVLLMPVLPYFDNMIANASSGQKDLQIDQHAMSLMRKSMCDAQGNFAFTGLPAKKWYVVTLVTWGVPHIEQPGERPGLIGLLLGFHGPPDIDKQGGGLLQTIDLHPGDNQTFLTDRDRK